MLGAVFGETVAELFTLLVSTVGANRKIVDSVLVRSRSPVICRVENNLLSHHESLP